ncbi:hypothetical protein ACA910_014851 [Epithemia clementina (nom. ined.)]
MIEVIPKGVQYNNYGRCDPISSWGGIAAGQVHINTFDVVPNHVQLHQEGTHHHQTQDGKKQMASKFSTIGVCFNVETVPEPLPEHKNKPIKSRKDLIKALKYREKIEALSDAVDKKGIHAGSHAELVHVGSNGFIMAIMTAFAQHLPLVLTPDHIWTLISYAFAKHVDQNAEQLRRNFVQHQGKERLFLQTPDNFRMSNHNDPDTGASAVEWETFVFPEFSKQIRDHIGDGTYNAIAAEFSTTTSAAKAAHEITLMSAMKNYFGFDMSTGCGIPAITLLGEEQDWVALRARAEHLGSLMTPEFKDLWMPFLLPVLDEFVESYKGNVNHGFWQSMVKFRDTGDSSGAYSFLSGWVQVLVPYLASGKINRDLRPWNEMYFQGPELGDFPAMESTVPVEWEYRGRTVDLTFHAGIIGFTQVQQTPKKSPDTIDHTGALSPLIGWYVSRSPSKPLN